MSRRRRRVYIAAGACIAAACALSWFTQRIDQRAVVAGVRSSTASTQRSDPSPQPGSPGLATRRVASTPVPAEAIASTDPAPAHDEAALNRTLHRLLENVQQCHKRGRVRGRAELKLTLRPSGSVAGAELIGEPIASAAVSRCILAKAQAARIPAFEGGNIEVSRTVVLD